MLVTLGTISVLGHIVQKGTTGSIIHAFLQVVAQMLIGLVKELTITLLTNHLTQTLVRNSFMRHSRLHIVHITVVGKNNRHFAGRSVKPALAPAPTRLHLCIGVSDFLHILNDADWCVQFLTHLLNSRAHHVAVFLHGTLHLGVECFHLLVSHRTSLSLLRFTSCGFHHRINLTRLKNAIHLHRTRNNPRVSLRIRIRPVLVRTILRKTRKSCKRMLELTARVHAVTHGFLLVVHIVRILHLCPHKISGEQLLLPCLGIQTVELQSIRNLTQVPTGTISQPAAATLCSLASCLHLLPACLRHTGNRSSVSVKPNTHRSSLTTRIRHHRRIEFAILQHKHLIADTCLCGWFVFAEAVTCGVLCHIVAVFVRKFYTICRFHRSIHLGILGFFLCHFRFHQFLILGKFFFGLLQLVGMLKRFAVTRLYLLQLTFVSF